MGLRAIVTHDLTDLVVRQALNQPRAHEQRKSQRRRRVEHGDVHIGNFTQSGTHVHSQTEVNHAPMTFNVTTSPRDTSGRTRRDVADGTEHTGVQIGLNFGSINTSRADDQD